MNSQAWAETINGTCFDVLSLLLAMRQFFLAVTGQWRELGIESGAVFFAVPDAREEWSCRGLQRDQYSHTCILALDARSPNRWTPSIMLLK